MALQHAASGDKISLKRSDDDIASFTSVALTKTEHMELMRILVTRDKPIPEHKLEGEMSLVCLEGELLVDAYGKTTTLKPMEMLYLSGGVSHAIRASEDSIGLMTILLHPC